VTFVEVAKRGGNFTSHKHVNILHVSIPVKHNTSVFSIS
jgi:hypothetical protein